MVVTVDSPAMTKMQNFCRASKNDGPIYTHSGSYVHKILGQCRGSSVVFNAISQLSLSSSKPQIIRLKVTRLAKVSKKVVLGPQISWAPIPKKSLHSILLPTNTCHLLKFRKDRFRGGNHID